MSFSYDRLKRISTIQSDLKDARRANEVYSSEPYQAVELKQLAADIRAAYGPTMPYMQGMDPYA